MSSSTPTNIVNGDTMMTIRPYQLRPLSRCFGMEVLGIDMSNVELGDDNVLKQLKNDLIEHRVLLFRKQTLTGQRQVEISRAFGQVQSTFYKHPRSPHPDIFRVSNNEDEGCTQVGRSGWHIDGTFQYRPFMYQTMYFPSVADGGDTYFIPLKELYESVSDETRARWDKLWMMTGRREAPIHPLVCQHPFRKNEITMVFHCGPPFVKGWLQDDESSNRVNPNLDNVVAKHAVQQELTHAIESSMDEICLKMKWEPGDFMINDNLGLAHYATEGTQTSWKSVGLRILHRTTIVGGPETVPTKTDGRQSFKHI
jgi:taurine dioxygenase